MVHVRAFAHVGGVPQRLVYDNLTLAAHRRVGSHYSHRLR
jgi:transposase